MLRKILWLFLLVICFNSAFSQEKTMSCSVVEKEFRLGSRGENVTKLQKILVEHGYLKTNIFGYFGPATKKAVALAKRNCTIKSVVASTSSPMVQVNGSPFRLELSADKYLVNTDEQVVFSVKLIHVGTSTYKEMKLGSKECNSDNLNLSADLKFDGNSSFWPMSMLGHIYCGNKTIGNFLTDFKPGDSYIKKFAYRNYSSDPMNTTLTVGNITEGEHTASATYTLNLDGKDILLTSNPVKFYTKTKKEGDVNVKVTASLDKSQYKKGERVKMTMKIKNVGNDDINFSSYNGSCLPSYVEFVIDVHSNLQFFVEKSNDIRCFGFSDPSNFLNVKIKKGEERTFDLDGYIPEFVNPDNTYLVKKLKGQHGLYARFYYRNALGVYREFKSETVKFNVQID